MPLAAIFTAPVINDFLKSILSPVKTRWLTASAYSISVMYWILALSILIFVFPGQTAIPWIMLISGIGCCCLLVIRMRSHPHGIIFTLAMSAIMVNLVLNLHFYPRLMKYQTGKQIANEWNKKGINNERLYYFQYHSPALDFHLGFAPPVVNESKVNRIASMGRQFWLVTDANGIADLDSSFIADRLVFESYPTQALSLTFLNNKTRRQVLQKTYLVKIIKPGQGVSR
jgi:hypothetical protein